MNENNEQSPEIEALYKRFEDLFQGTSLSDEERLSLSQEMLKIVYDSSEEIVP